jgi:hypothetical protein
MRVPDTIDLSGSERDIARWLWRNLVPKSGQCDTVQGELLRAVEKLSWEAQENGNVNWDSGFDLFVAFLRYHLRSLALSAETRNSLEQDLLRLSEFLPVGELEDDAQLEQLPCVDEGVYDRMTSHVVEFCRQNPRLIPHTKNPLQTR